MRLLAAAILLALAWLLRQRRPATARRRPATARRRHEYDYRDTICAETGLHPASCDEHASCPLIDRCLCCGKVREEARRHAQRARTYGAVG